MSEFHVVIPLSAVAKLEEIGAFDMQDKYLDTFGVSFRVYDHCHETPEEYLETITAAYEEKLKEKMG